MDAVQIHEDSFLKILWDEKTRVIGIDWKEATSSMSDKDFQKEMALFAGHVEQKRARGILVEVSNFRHKMGPGVQEWRVKNIIETRRYAG